MNTKKLNELYNTPIGKDFFDHALAGGDVFEEKEMPVAEAYKGLYSKWQYREFLDFLRGMEKEGFGRVLLGRRGGGTRFVSAVPVMKIAEAAQGRIATQTHTFVIRPNFSVKIDLPLDLTEREATRLAKAIEVMAL